MTHVAYSCSLFHVLRHMSHVSDIMILAPCPMSYVPCVLAHIPNSISHVLCRIHLSNVSCSMFFGPMTMSHIPHPTFLVPCPTSHIPCPKSHVPSRTFHVPCPKSHVSRSTPSASINNVVVYHKALTDTIIKEMQTEKNTKERINEPQARLLSTKLRGIYAYLKDHPALFERRLYVGSKKPDIPPHQVSTTLYWMCISLSRSGMTKCVVWVLVARV